MVGLKELFLTTLLTFSLISNLICTGSSKLDHQTTLYFGKFDQDEQKQPIEFWILYDGELIKTNKQEYTLSDQMLTQLQVIFIDPSQIQFKASEENTIKKLAYSTNNYLCYQLDLTQDHNHEPEEFINTWKINNLNLNNQIPLNTVIVPINPKLVDIEVENVTWRASNRAIKLPIFKLTKKSTQSASLVKIIAESCLKCLNIRPFHAKQRTASVRNKTTQSSIVLS